MRNYDRHIAVALCDSLDDRIERRACQYALRHPGAVNEDDARCSGISGRLE